MGHILGFKVIWKEIRRRMIQKARENKGLEETPARCNRQAQQ